MAEEKSLYELVRCLAELFREFHVRYALIGGLAVKKYDDYRLTYDIDLVAAPLKDTETAKRFVASLLDWARERNLAISTKADGERLPASQVTKELVEKVVREGGRTLEFWREGRKFIDLIFGAGSDRMRRGLYKTIDGINVASPEYLIVSKLCLIRQRKAEDRDFRDVIRLLSLPGLDRRRLKRYAGETGVSMLLERYERKIQKAGEKIRKTSEG
jgi:hypothetical protein